MENWTVRRVFGAVKMMRHSITSELPGPTSSKADQTKPSGHLPIVNIQVEEQISPEKKVSCTLVLSALKGLVWDSKRDFKGQIRIRGASSQSYDKKSFSVKLDTPTSWFGLGENRDWVLNAAAVDCSLMRHKLSYDLFRSLSTGNAKRFAVASRFIEVVINGRYHGLYLLMEPVDRLLLKLERYDSKVSEHAVIYKAIDHGANFKQPGHIDFEQREPSPETGDYWEPLDGLNFFVSKATDREFFDIKSGIASRVDIDNCIDFYLLVLFTSNMDGVDKNFILARDMQVARLPQRHFFFVPWDYDATFGRNWDGSSVEPTEWLSNHLFDRLLGNGLYKQKLRARWRQLRKVQLSSANIFSMIDTNAKTIGPAATCNERRWKEGLNPNSGELTFSSDLKQMKQWVAKRIRWLDTEIVRRTRP